MYKFFNTLLILTNVAFLYIGYEYLDSRISQQTINTESVASAAVRCSRNLEIHAQEADDAYEELALKVTVIDLMIRHLVGEKYGTEQQY